MWTIIKSVLRFFKKSKLLMIGLITLIFFSSSIFTLLNTTTNNLEKAYNKISKDGQLHDFVINEHYLLGFADYKYTVSSNRAEDNNGNKKTYATYEFSPTTDDTGKVNWTNSYLYVYEKYSNDQSSYYSSLIKFSKEFESTMDNTGNYKPVNETDFSSFVNSKKTELTNFTNANISKVFKDYLVSHENLPIETRKFRALDVNQTQQKIFFKVVESSPDYSIDKVVYYSGNHLTKPNNIYNEIFGNITNINDNNQLNITTRLLVKYLSLSDWSDKKREQESIEFNKYLELNPNINAYTDAQTTHKGIQDIAKKFVNSVTQKTSNNYSVVNKNFQIRFEYTSGAPVTAVYDDFNSYQMIISPYYASVNNKKPINIEEWNKHKSDSQKEFIQFIRSLPDENKIKIDEIEYIVFGTGISPDFMYPILSFDSLVPNKEKEQVVYANSNGYERIYDSFRGNNQENFEVGKFKGSFSYKRREEILSKINEISTKFMAWPSNINAAYFFDDSNNTLTPTSLRVQFVPQTVQATNTVSLFMTSFVLILSIFVSIIIIRRFIESNRNSLGIMQANGYRKREIIFAINIFIFIPSFIASIAGYFLGLSLQTPAIDLLGNFWTIPTTISSFNILSLIIVCLGIASIFALITTLFSWLSLKGETSEFMKDDAKYKMSRVARILKLPFSKFSILTRFRAAIAFSSLWRLIILSVMSACLMVSLTFSFAVLNKFNEASIASFAPRNYVYSMNLITPTLQGGQYYAVPYQYQGMTLEKNLYFNTQKLSDYYSNENIYQDIENDKNRLNINKKYISQWYESNSYKNIADANPELKKLMLEFGNYQLTTLSDNSDLKTKLKYTEFKTSTKTLLDHNAGIAGIIATNPWALAESMMPPNNASYANKTFTNLFEKVYKDNESKLKIKLGNTIEAEKTYHDILEYFTKESLNPNSSSSFLVGVDSNGNQLYRELDSSKTIKVATLQGDFLFFIYSVFANPIYKEFMYGINYNKIVINETDEPFSYMDFKINEINGKVVNIIDSLRSTGFGANSLRFDLKNANGKKINNTLLNDTFYPIIINEFAKKKYGLNIGDEISIEVLNSADRYSRKIHGKDNIKVIDKLKIVEVVATYQGSEFFMNQYDVNKILGLDINNIKPNTPTKEQITNNVLWENNLPSKNEFIVNRSGFNGILTTDENSLVEVTNGVSIYSPSGVYPGTDKIEEQSPVLNSIFNGGEGTKNKEIIATLFGDPNLKNEQTNKIISLIEMTFGNSSAFTILTQATSRNSLLSVFSSVIDTTSNIQNVVLGIIIVVSLIIVIIISSIIINDSIKLAAILKCLGLRDSRNAFTFLSVYFPVLFIGLIIAVPFSLLVNHVYISIIFSFAGILLTIPLIFWHYLLSTFIIILIFLVSYWIAWYRIYNMNLTHAIK